MWRIRRIIIYSTSFYFMMIKTLERMAQVIPLKIIFDHFPPPFILVIDLKIPPHPCSFLYEPWQPGERGLF
jgi:hypothetical protein